MKKTDAAYIAGLFDGEGTITYKKYNSKKGKKYYNTWAIELCIEMTDESVLRWIYEVLNCGSLNERKTLRPNRKRIWRFRVKHRDAYNVCRIIWPYAHVKLPKIQQIIDHYGGKIFNNKVVDLDSYRKIMVLE